MSPADGFPWGAAGNLQSVPLGVLFGHDLTFIQNTKCAKQSNYLNLVKGMQTTRRALHELRGSTETMAMMFGHTRTLKQLNSRMLFKGEQSGDFSNHKTTSVLYCYGLPLNASWTYHQGSFCLIVNTFNRLLSVEPCLLSMETTGTEETHKGMITSFCLLLP